MKIEKKIDEDMQEMRKQIMKGMMEEEKRNEDRGLDDIELLEVQGIYEGDKKDKKRRVEGGVRRGKEKVEGEGSLWDGNEENVGVLDEKEDEMEELEDEGEKVESIKIEEGGNEWINKGSQGKMKIGKKVVIGNFGEFNKEKMEEIDV